MDGCRENLGEDELSFLFYWPYLAEILSFFKSNKNTCLISQNFINELVIWIREFIFINLLLLLRGHLSKNILTKKEFNLYQDNGFLIKKNFLRFQEIKKINNTIKKDTNFKSLFNKEDNKINPTH